MMIHFEFQITRLINVFEDNIKSGIFLPIQSDSLYLLLACP